MDWILALAAAIGCVIANAFFVATEFALAKVRPTALATLAEKGDPRASRAMLATKHLDAYLTATQLGITLASLGLGWLGEPAVANLIDEPLLWAGVPTTMLHGIALTISFVVITLLHVVLGELVPKTIAIQKPELITLWFVRPMQWFLFIAHPLLTLFNQITFFLLRIFGFRPAAESDNAISATEMRMMIRSIFSEHGTDATKRDLLDRVFRSSDRPVRSIMVPRVDMVTLDHEQDFDSAMTAVRVHGFSRFPLINKGDPDSVLGYIYVKDLLMALRPPKGGLRALRRDLLFVPETCTVADALADLRRARIPIAIVVDEYGGTSGLLTLEDIVEEIVGDIQDELDTENPRVQMHDDGSMTLDGSIPIDEISIPDLVLPEGMEPGSSIGAVIVSALGRLAHPGDRVRLGGVVATVQDVRRRRIQRVGIKVGVGSSLPPAPGP